MMKVAIFSDVQANLPAMQVAVEQILAWGPDLVIMDGDLVNRGPKSLACLEVFDHLRRTHGWLPVNGNHETWIRHLLLNPPLTPLAAQMRLFGDWTARQLLPRLADLCDWPDHLCFDGGHDASWVHVTHGTLASNRQGISARVTDADLRGTLPPDIALFVTAHTHRPLSRVLDGTSILNVGSVGSPFDGDPRGSYALLEQRNGRWQWEIIRFNYDREQMERDFRESGFIDEGGPLARILFEEWRQARPLMPLWRRAHESAVLCGERTLESAVAEFIRGVI